MDAKQNDSDNSDLTQPDETLLEQAEILIWALLDDEIDRTDVIKLEAMLQDNDQVRAHYVKCVQMHADLHQHFGDDPGKPLQGKRPDSPVLGSLGDLRPGTDSWPPVAE